MKWYDKILTVLLIIGAFAYGYKLYDDYNSYDRKTKRFDDQESLLYDTIRIEDYIEGVFAIYEQIKADKDSE